MNDVVNVVVSIISILVVASPWVVVVHCFCCWEYSSSVGEAARRHRRRRHRRQKMCVFFSGLEEKVLRFLFFCGCLWRISLPPLFGYLSLKN